MIINDVLLKQAAAAVLCYVFDGALKFLSLGQNDEGGIPFGL